MLPADPFRLTLDINQDPDAIINLTAENQALIIYIPDVLTKTASATSKNIIEVLALKPGALANKINLPGATPFTGKKAGKLSNFGTTHDEDLPIYIPGNTPATAELVDRISKGGRFMIIAKQAAYKGTSAYRYIYGYECGMYGDTPTLDTSKDGGTTITMKSVNNSKSGYFLYKTSDALTQTLEDTLTVAAV